MSVTWVCDLCGKPTYVNPPYKLLTEKKTVSVPTPSVNSDGKVEVKLVDTEVEVPKIAKMRRQNPFSGEMEEVEIQDMEFLAEKTCIVRLNVGDEQIQKDFCQDCVQQHLPKIKELWDLLASIKSQ